MKLGISNTFSDGENSSRAAGCRLLTLRPICGCQHTRQTSDLAVCGKQHLRRPELVQWRHIWSRTRTNGAVIHPGLAAGRCRTSSSRQGRQREPCRQARICEWHPGASAASDTDTGMSPYCSCRLERADLCGREGALLHTWDPFSGSAGTQLVDIQFFGSRLLALSARATVQSLIVTGPDTLYLSAQVCCDCVLCFFQQRMLFQHDHGSLQEESIYNHSRCPAGSPRHCTVSGLLEGHGPAGGHR